MPRFFARYNIDVHAWEVFDTMANAAVESFSCGQDEELRHYAEHRALAHANRMNQQADRAAAEGSSEPQSQ